MPTVINAYHYAPLSPKRPELPAPWIYVGRRHPVMGEASALANPFTLKQHGIKALELFRRHLHYEIQRQNPAIMAALDQIQPETALVCFCKKPDGSGDCHADIIAAAWNYLQTQRTQASQIEQPSPTTAPTEQPELEPEPTRPEQIEQRPPELEPLPPTPEQLEAAIIERLQLRVEAAIIERLERQQEERHQEQLELMQPAGRGPIYPAQSLEAEAIAIREADARRRAAPPSRRSPDEQWEINRRGLEKILALFARKKAEQLTRSSTRRHTIPQEDRDASPGALERHGQPIAFQVIANLVGKALEGAR